MFHVCCPRHQAYLCRDVGARLCNNLAANHAGAQARAQAGGLMQPKGAITSGRVCQAWHTRKAALSFFAALDRESTLPTITVASTAALSIRLISGRSAEAG